MSNREAAAPRRWEVGIEPPTEAEQQPHRDSTQRLPRRGLLAVTCYLCLFFFALYFGAVSVLLPFLGEAFHLGAAVEGRLFPASSTGFIVGVLLFGFLSDRWGRKAVLLAGIALYTLGLLLFGLAPSFALALPASALIGGGGGAMETVASALAADLFPERRAFHLNAIQVAFGVGAAFSPYVAQFLLMRGMDWRTLYLGLAAAEVGLFLLLSVQKVPRAPHASEAVDFAALRWVLKQPVFLALCLAQGLYVGAEVGFASWLPTYFRTSLPGGMVWSGVVVTLFWIAMTIGRIGVGPLIDRIPLLRLAILLALGGVVGSALAMAWTSPWVVLCWVAWTGLCFSGIFGLILAEVGTLFPKAAGSAFGGIVASGGVGGAIVPWAVALLASTALTWRGALLLIPTATAGIVLVLFCIGRTGED
ncbi:MAG TPA: MFS transporter [Chthonomonadaceae bacterium]|nr:MFS transporter [Chthonomonadaceae bacterium]